MKQLPLKGARPRTPLDEEYATRKQLAAEYLVWFATNFPKITVIPARVVSLFTGTSYLLETVKQATNNMLRGVYKVDGDRFVAMLPYHCEAIEYPAGGAKRRPPRICSSHWQKA